MPLYKFVKIWFVLPGIFCTLFLFLALLFAIISYTTTKNRKLIWLPKFGMFTCLISAVIIFVVSINACSQRFLNSLEYQYTRSREKTDAIFVLGGNDYARIKSAYTLFKIHGVDVVVSGYNGGAEHMQRELLKLGVPANKIILEPKASNTKEHPKYMLPIASKNGYRNIYIVTNAYHMPRAMKCFEKPANAYGVNLLTYPCGYQTPKEYRPNRYEWIMDAFNLNQSAIAWNEYLGMLLMDWQ